MKNTTLKMLSLGLLSLAASVAFANGNGNGNDGKNFIVRIDHPGPVVSSCHGNDRKCFSAPEIDPAQAMGALMLVSGALAIARGRRRKK